MNKFLITFTILLSTSFAWSQPDIQVQGLFTGKAVLNINGQLRMLSEGQTSPEGVQLVNATPSIALVSFGGEQFKLDLSSRISSAFTQAKNKEVRLLADSRGHHITQARINGRMAEVLLDTGASVVAMSTSHAQQLGIDYKDALTGMVSTANGRIQTYLVTLNSVQIGDIKVSSVEAAIAEGEGLETILLGNSFLSHVEMRNEGSVMVLTTPF